MNINEKILLEFGFNIKERPNGMTDYIKELHYQCGFRSYIVMTDWSGDKRGYYSVSLESNTNSRFILATKVNTVGKLKNFYFALSGNKLISTF